MIRYHLQKSNGKVRYFISGSAHLATIRRACISSFRERHQVSRRKIERNTDGGTERYPSQSPSLHNRRHPRPILGLERAFSNRRGAASNQLLVHGRLRGPRILLGRDYDGTCHSEDQISQESYHLERQSRKQVNHPDLWILWRVLEKVWKLKCLGVVYRSFRLLTALCRRWRIDFLPSWRFVP